MQDVMFETLEPILGLDSIDEEVVEPTRSIADPEARFLDIVSIHAPLLPET